MTGRISLYQKGNLISTREYSGPAHKELIVGRWEKYYGRGFSKTSILDEPFTKQERKGNRLNK